MLDRAQALVKIAKIILALSPQDQRMVAFDVHRTFGGPLTNAERAQRHRAGRRNEIVTETVTKPLLPDVTERVETVTPTQSFLRFYSEQFGLVFGSKPLINYAKDGSIVKKLLRQFGEQELRKLLSAYLRSDDDFVRKTGFTLGVFQTVINKLLVEKNGHGTLSAQRIYDEAQIEKLEGRR